MVPAEIHIGCRARLCITDDGHGYFYGTVKEFDGERALLEMDSGSVIRVPWWELVGTEEPPRKLDPVQKLEALLMEGLLFPAPPGA